MGARRRTDARHGRNALFPAASGVGRGWTLRAAHRSPRYVTTLDELPHVRA